MNNKIILENANKAITKGDHETFLSYLTDDIIWTFVGEQVISGKDQVRRYINDTYRQPPKFDVETLIEEGNYVTAVGRIALMNKNDEWIEYNYCDIWRFEDAKMAELKAFVIKI
ncbi:nuclear transport factor 2 family protein [Chryseobacterium luteum]|uniref:Ketosteroid isomerase n=1 Tax=Chryseobacterium luteum TaxID=421531 RepID=A0A085Z6G1_9FLAO|nr:nuclear transport factor 2 family protein [Chryseobacterium luteum]KFF00025.1 ketosteroid isomerase [Chryseobacterium luteum]